MVSLEFALTAEGLIEMILFSSNRLERALAGNTLNSWEKAKYIIFVIIFYGFSGPIYVITPSFGPKPPLGNSLATFVSAILTIIFTFFGAKKCFLTNKANDDSDFAGRFAALFIPMTFKFFAISAIVMAISAILVSLVSPDKEMNKRFFVYFLHSMAPIGTYLFYLFLNRSFKRLGVLHNGRDNNS